MKRGVATRIAFRACYKKRRKRKTREISVFRKQKRKNKSNDQKNTI